MFRSTLLRECEAVARSSFNIYTISRQKIFFVVCAHAGDPVIQQNTLLQPEGFTFLGIILEGTPRCVQFFLFLCLAFLSLFFFILYMYVHV